jgi:hypothetical protein
MSGDILGVSKLALALLIVVLSKLLGTAGDVEAMTSATTRNMKSSGDLEVVIAFEPE